MKGKKTTFSLGMPICEKSINCWMNASKLFRAHKPSDIVHTVHSNRIQSIVYCFVAGRIVGENHCRSFLLQSHVILMKVLSVIKERAIIHFAKNVFVVRLAVTKSCCSNYRRVSQRLNATWRKPKPQTQHPILRFEDSFKNPIFLLF